VLTGSSSVLDALVICPGIHLQQASTNLNGGEYPACGAMTTGYVFRVENPATVYYLQQMCRTGHLTTFSVSELKTSSWHEWLSTILFSSEHTPIIPALAYAAAVLWTIAVILLMGFSHDWWGLGLVLVLAACRIVNVVVIRRRSMPGWFGAPEPDVDGDLLVLLSQDRWARIQGKVDYLKAVTSGQWLRDQTLVESWATALVTLVVYLAAALVSNATQFGKILLMALFGGSAGLLAIANSATNRLMMHGYVVKQSGERKKYERRRMLADELIEETKRKDWAIRMGMIPAQEAPNGTAEEHPVVM
jgi:hypothetical protein